MLSILSLNFNRLRSSVGHRVHLSALLWPLLAVALAVAVANPQLVPGLRLADFALGSGHAPQLFTIVSTGGQWLAAALGFLSTTGLTILSVVGIVAVIAGTYGFLAGWKRVVVKEREMRFETLPAEYDGYRIVQLSDLHMGTYRFDPRVVDRIVERVNAMNPDLIVFTGDLVNRTPDELTPFIPVLSRLKSRDGVVSIMGNHDYCVYGSYKTQRERVEAIHRLQSMQREELGWRLLLNENMTVDRNGEKIALVGVENAGKGFVDHADLPRAMRGVDPGMFTIMLSHDPCHWRNEILPDTDIPLTLAGHTHAMQFRLGPLSPSRLLYKEWNGVYCEGNRLLHVNPGTGSNVPFRLGAWPEINMLTLKRG